MKTQSHCAHKCITLTNFLHLNLQMLFFLVTSISFFLFLNSLNLKQLPSWTTNVRFLPLCFWKDIPFFPTYKSMKRSVSTSFYSLSSVSPLKQVKSSSNMKVIEHNKQISVLDLPELPLECILEKLSPVGLFSMAGVCSSLRERCTSDHLWEKHMDLKWSRVLGPGAYREWQWYISTKVNTRVYEKKRSSSSNLVTFLSNLLDLSKVDKETVTVTVAPLVNSVMSLYLSLESGKFWFPAQVYNRENGHVGFMLSCYDAELSYDAQTDTFQARYPPHGRKTVAIESGVQWERLRASPIDTPPYDLHFSGCLSDLHPGDHIEIQWRRNKEFPYGWWYGVVGHLESCDGNENYCRCHSSDNVMLEFNQYTPGSRWRRTMVNRKDHREKGNETDGYYGGIRKLYKNEEIATWKRLWPREILE